MSDYQNRANSLYDSLLQIESSCAPDQLFLCSYLIGHISLVGADEGNTAEQLEQNVQHSLDEAFKVDRLTDADRETIISLWGELLAKPARPKSFQT
ncbi:MAG: YfcL family protein [Amphritea sp.]